MGRMDVGKVDDGQTLYAVNETGTEKEKGRWKMIMGQRREKLWGNLLA
jgi:hypothetical protein